MRFWVQNLLLPHEIPFYNNLVHARRGTPYIPLLSNKKKKFSLFSFFFFLNKVSLLTSLERNSSNFLYISFLGVNFENLSVEFHIPHVFNMHIKFCSNRILFTIWSINLFFIYNYRLQKFKIITFIWWHSNWFLIFLKFCN